MGTANFSITLRPEFPQPGDTVSATLTDYCSSSYGSAISWVLDGETTLVVTIQREIAVTEGPAGEVQTLQAVLGRVDGQNEVLQATIKPIYRNIIIEPQTRVLRFYRGQALPSVASMVNATPLISGDDFYNPAYLVCA